MDVLLGVAALVVLISVPTLLGLIYLELRQRRMFGPRSIITNERANNDTAAIAMSLQAELERLRSDVHGILTAVSSNMEQVREEIASREPVSIPAPIAQPLSEPPRIDSDRSAAIVDLYSALSRLDVAFLAVTRPVLLPGEAFDGGDDLPTEALRWESWNDVGAAAYHFAEVFSERRIRLDPPTRDHLTGTIGSIRRCLTERLYPLLSD
ncbi:MAG TPA: hypothetical protein VHR64_09700, partial [Thermomicrobiales bacterium]|nr:hypothetical protein [Thermomicrobiales bacterium]